MTARALAEFDLEVFAAANGREAIAAALSVDFDLILMDVVMPEINGVAAARHIRAAGINATIVGFTAGASNEVSECAEFNGFVYKPIDYRKVIEQWLPDAVKAGAPSPNEPRVDAISEIELPDGRIISRDSPTQVLIDLAKSFDAGEIDLNVAQVESLCQWLFRRPPERDTLVEQWLDEHG
jgi:CheY-like chemotaxis protein